MAGVPSAELLERWTTRALTRAGVQICIRPLRPDDREREIAFINGLSDQSRYFRLMTPFKVLPRHLVDQLMDIDYSRRMAFVATVPTCSGEQFIGIARYGETAEPGVAELAVSVADEWQRNGVARLLITQLLRFAQSHGVRRITGIVLPENAPMIGLAHSLGFAVALEPAQHLITIDRELPADVRGETRAVCGESPVSAVHPAH
ncbi:MAG TPA: GNAT family N-acetyltransferase [Steroidobacteraceae bacterium]|nr:GNAT family N-acetyltransferase [Steroidobacteraceae bacterium]